MRLRIKTIVGFVVAGMAALMGTLGAMGLPIGLSPTSTVHSLRSIPLDDVQAPNFSLISSSSDRRVTLGQFRGKTVVISFVNPACKKNCPPSAALARQTRSLLGSKANRVVWLGINVDPLSPSGTVPRSADGPWILLSGTVPALWAVWRAYHVNVSVIHGQIAYTAANYVIDGRGRETALTITRTDISVPKQARVLATSVAKVSEAANP